MKSLQKAYQSQEKLCMVLRLNYFMNQAEDDLNLHVNECNYRYHYVFIAC